MKNNKEGKLPSETIHPDKLFAFSVEMSEEYQKFMIRFSDELKKGNTDRMQELLVSYHKNFKPYYKSITELRTQVHLLNLCCLCILFDTNVHPVHTMSLYSTMQNRINNATNENALRALPERICHKYCLLVHNYSYSEYSKAIRDVLNYIHLHLEENLTLATLAAYVHKDPTALSYRFHQEVGQNITDYVHETRIKAAVKYFNSTDLSVSEVAMTVGFQDFAYFSRLFKRQIGLSPREYIKSIRTPD